MHCSIGPVGIFGRWIHLEQFLFRVSFVSTRGVRPRIDCLSLRLVLFLGSSPLEEDELSELSESSSGGAVPFRLSFLLSASSAHTNFGHVGEIRNLTDFPMKIFTSYPSLSTVASFSSPSISSVTYRVFFFGRRILNVDLTLLDIHGNL